MKHIECNQCKSLNTEIELNESYDDEDEYLYINVWCLDCMTYSPFPDDKDWREYK